jgi:hypothetical protein
MGEVRREPPEPAAVEEKGCREKEKRSQCGGESRDGSGIPDAHGAEDPSPPGPSEEGAALLALGDEAEPCRPPPGHQRHGEMCRFVKERRREPEKCLEARTDPVEPGVRRDQEESGEKREETPLPVCPENHRYPFSVTRRVPVISGGCGIPRSCRIVGAMSARIPDRTRASLRASLTSMSGALSHV